MEREILRKAMREARYRHHLTQTQVAQMLGVSQACYNRWENGKQPITMDSFGGLMVMYYNDPEFQALAKEARSCICRKHALRMNIPEEHLINEIIPSLL